MFRFRARAQTHTCVISNFSVSIPKLRMMACSCGTFMRRFIITMLRVVLFIALAMASADFIVCENT